jgi:hypothetical protein
MNQKSSFREDPQFVSGVLTGNIRGLRMRHFPLSGRTLRSMSVGELASLQELVASDQAEAATRMDKFRAQLRSSQRLNEYYSHAVAEIRASLDGTHHEGS